MNGVTETGEDALLGGRVRLVQMKVGYRAAIDPVLLAASLPARAGDKVLDLGSGVGAAALCLVQRVPGVSLTGLDIQETLVDLAKENTVLNEKTDNVTFLAGDLHDPPQEISEGAFDHVMANPPFLGEEQGNLPPNAAKAIANVEGEAGLSDWVDAAVRAVKRKGSVTFIHRADRIDDLLAAFHGVLGEVTVFPLWPGRNKAAKRVLVSARKGVASPARLSPGLVLHQSNGKFTPEADVVLRDGAPLHLYE